MHVRAQACPLVPSFRRSRPRARERSVTVRRVASTRRVALGVSLAVLGTTGTHRPLAAQEAAPRLTGSQPAALMVDATTGRTSIRLEGERIQDRELRWTARLYHYFVRRAGDEAWRRMFVNPQGDYYETYEDVAPLRVNGESTGYGSGFRTFALPNDRYLASPGALEFRIERGHWRERTVIRDDEDHYVVDFIVDGNSNVLRVPVRPLPTEPPVVGRVEPEHVPVLGTGTARAEITVLAQNLTPATRATVGVEPCEIREIDPVGGWLRCLVPASLQATPGTYLVGVTTERGGARRLARLHVDGPLALGAPEPATVPVADSVVTLVVPYRGGFPFEARVRRGDGEWHRVVPSDAGRAGAVLELSPELTRSPGTLEIQLANAAGPDTLRLPVCGGEGDQPRGCPVTLSRAPLRVMRPRAGPPEVRPPPAQQRPRLRLAPGGAVALRPQPEPPGLVAVPLAASGVLRLADGGRLAWRAVDGARRLVRLGPDGGIRVVYAEGATPARDAAGRLFVRLAGGVRPLGVRVAEESSRGGQR